MKITKGTVLTLISGAFGLGSIVLNFISGKVDSARQAEEQKELIKEIGRQIAEEVKKGS